MELYPRKRQADSVPRWYIDHYEDGRRYFFSLGTSDRKIAEVRAAKWLRDLKREKTAAELGIETHSGTRSESFDDLLDELADHLLRKGTGVKRIEQVLRRCGRLLELTGAETLAGVTPTSISEALCCLRVRRKVKGGSLSDPRWRESIPAARTANRHLQALGQLFKFLVRRGRWANNPCDAVERRKERPTYERSSLTPEMLVALLGSVPRHRALVYHVASTTGLRRKELNSLPWRDVNLQDRIVTVRAKRAKNNRRSDLPITASVVSEWTEYRRLGIDFMDDAFRGSSKLSWERRIGNGLALPSIPSPDTLRRDLVKLGLDLDDMTGEDRLDFHCLRVTLASNLARAGQSLQIAQKLMRHSDPKLTAAIYTKLDLVDGRSALEGLEVLMDKARKEPRKNRRKRAF